MKNRVLVTEGTGSFFESVYEVPELGPTDIRVRAVMTGVCRSDVDMMVGDFPTLPISMMGHEGLGQVVEIGTDVKDVETGDYVATRGEPAYADYYNVRKNEYVKVPEPHQRYIAEPVACALNIAYRMRSGTSIIIGSGFLAHIVAQQCKASPFGISVDAVVGSSNIEQWDNINITLNKRIPNAKYDNVVILSAIDFDKALDLCNENGMIIIGSLLKESKTDFSRALWSNITIVCPSPRDEDFGDCMWEAVEAVKSGKIDVDWCWTKGYNRKNYEQAFEDARNRPAGYVRGYIKW